MSNLVIVAIPDENDRVWKVSSEKVPHLTLLFLGDSEQVSNTQQIVEFVEHAANTSLRRFYLPVDRRDELGADQADVLFFKKSRYDYKAIRDFRGALLKDNNIRTAYDSAPQFDGPWQPHLTLGYPTAPANPMPNDWGEQFYSVDFNKIAVWIDDFDGPEFLLKDYWDEIDEFDPPLDIAMSSMNQERVKAGLAALDHSGVKGMKWGVRRSESAKASDKAANPPKEKSGIKQHLIARSDKKFEKKANSAYNFLDVYNEGAKNYNRTDLKKINDKPEYKDADFTKPSELRTKYYKEHQDAFLKHVEAAAEAKTNASGTRKYGIHVHDDNSFDIITKEVKHADGDTSTPVKVTLDAKGFVTAMEIDMDETTQTALHGATFVDGLMHNATVVDDLMHFGTKGMKWGVRKAPPSAVAPKATSHVPHGDKRKTKIETEGGQNHPAHADAIHVAQAKVKLAKSGPAALSNKELRDVAQRVQLEQQVKQLVQPAGQRFVKRLLGQQGNQAANEVVNKQVKRKLATAALI